jgi:hypothetical protein
MITGNRENDETIQEVMEIGKIPAMKKVLLLLLIAITFVGCATDSDPDRYGLWDVVKDKAESVLGKDDSATAQAKEEAREASEEQYRANPKF